MKTGRHMIKVSLLVEQETYEKLSAYAQLADVSVFEVIRQGLAEWTRSIPGVRPAIKMPGSNVTNGPLLSGTQ
jgi:hypothetical protein